MIKTPDFNYAFSMTALYCVLEEFNKRFPKRLGSIMVDVSIESIFYAIDVRESKKDIKILKKKFGIKNIFFACDRKLPEYAWAVRSLQLGKQLTSNAEYNEKAKG